MLAITTTLERTGHWIKIRRPRARFSALEISNRMQSSADFITITCVFRFSVHTDVRFTPESFGLNTILPAKVE
jgi:hypothetical protein